MKKITQEWVKKGEGDWSSAQREVRARKDPNYDSACYHAQQSAEKYLKARLVEVGIRFRKTHDLEELLNLVLPVEPMWNVLLTDLKFLNNDLCYLKNTLIDNGGNLQRWLAHQ
jgi:HEPN domain-containing protein